MSKAQRARLIALEAVHEEQEGPAPAIVAIRGVDGIIRANMPHPMEPEIFDDASELEARADELGLRCVLVLVVDGRRGATVQEEAPCAA